MRNRPGARASRSKPARRKPQGEAGRSCVLLSPSSPALTYCRARSARLWPRRLRFVEAASWGGAGAAETVCQSYRPPARRCQRSSPPSAGSRGRTKVVEPTALRGVAALSWGERRSLLPAPGLPRVFQIAGATAPDARPPGPSKQMGDGRTAGADRSRAQPWPGNEAQVNRVVRLVAVAVLVLGLSVTFPTSHGDRSRRRANSSVRSTDTDFNLPKATTAGQSSRNQGCALPPKSRKEHRPVRNYIPRNRCCSRGGHFDLPVDTGTTRTTALEDGPKMPVVHR